MKKSSTFFSTQGFSYKAMFRNALMVLVFSLVPLLSFTQTLKFIAYGDSRTNYTVHDNICTRMNTENPQLIVHSGDLWDGYASSTWVSHFTSKSNLNTLLNNNKILVARGNHETESAVLALSPSFVRDNSITYSFREGNVFFVSAGLSPSASYIESQLQKPEAQSADFRVLFFHYPIYSKGNYTYNGNAAVEAICDQYNVTMTFSGHDHSYQRSKIMYNQTPVYTGTDVPSNIQGTTYIVTGGAGAPLYTATAQTWTEKVSNSNHYCVLSSYSDRLEMVVKNASGTVIETFVRRTAPAVQHTLTVATSSQGVISPSTGSFAENEVVAVTATGNAGYTFDHWTGDLSGTTNPTTITMTGPKSIGAVYRVVPTYTLTTSAVNGTVSPSGTTTHSENATVTLTATPAAGYEFSHWSGAVSGTANPTSVVMSANKTVAANFILIPPSVGYNIIGDLTSATVTNRRAMPYTMPEDGQITSVSMYHGGGSGNVILAVYDGTTTTPVNRIAVTASTPINSSAGWQKINLIAPVQVAANAPVWLAFVYETPPTLYYTAGSPGRVSTTETWSGGMPTSWGSTATQSNYIYSIYASYVQGGGNQAPVADANGPYTGVEGTAVNFSSAGSTDPDGTIASYAWNFGDGSSSTLANPSHTYTAGGTFNVSLIVTDNGGKPSLASSTTATITALPKPPVAEANGPYTGKVNTAISFSSTGSTDPDGTIASYLWAFGDGSTSTQANPSHTYTSVGNYTATLTVTDNSGSTDSDNASVSVGTNQAPVAAINGPYSGTINNAVAFSSTGSNDPDGTVASYAWNFGDGSTSTLANPSHTYTTAGNYTVTLSVTDNEGAQSAEVNTTAVITDAPLDYALLPYSTGFESGSLDQYWFTQSDGSTGRIEVTTAQGPHTGSYQLAMDVSTSGTYVTNEAWLKLNLAGKTQVDFVVWWKESGDEDHTQDGIFISDDAGATFAKVYSLIGGTTTHQEIKLELGALAAANGMSLTNQFVVKLQQYDNYPFTSDGFGFDDISVTSPGPQPPVAVINGPYNGTINNPVAFSSAGSTDVGGSIVSYAWNFGDGSSSTQANPSHTYSSVGTYNISLTVTDNDGMTDVEYTTVTITEAPLDYALLPYSTGFESGSLDQYWFTQSDGPTGRIVVTTAQGPRTGSYQLAMDVSTSGNYVTNEAWLKLNLAGYSQVDFQVWWKESSDEDHTQDGIFLSDDAGATFVKVYNLTGGSSTHQQIVLDIDQLAAANGLSLSSKFVVKLQQYDNYPFTSDGFGFDDVNVTGSMQAKSSLSSIEKLGMGDVNLYPNPSSNGVINVSITGELTPDSYIRIYNISGVMVKSVKVESQLQLIELDNLAKGIYLLSVPVNGEAVSKRFIVQ